MFKSTSDFELTFSCSNLDTSTGRSLTIVLCRPCIAGDLETKIIFLSTRDDHMNCSSFGLQIDTIKYGDRNMAEKPNTR